MLQHGTNHTRDILLSIEIRRRMTTRPKNQVCSDCDNQTTQQQQQQQHIERAYFRAVLVQGGDDWRVIAINCELFVRVVRFAFVHKTKQTRQIDFKLTRVRFVLRRFNCQQFLFDVVVLVEKFRFN